MSIARVLLSRLMCRLPLLLSSRLPSRLLARSVSRPGYRLHFRSNFARLPRHFAGLAAVLALATLSLTGCAGWFGTDPVRVSVAGIEPIDGQGLEMRFNVKLRVQNPNESAVSFDGVSLDLDLNGKSFASGVSDQSGTVPRYGETVVNVPLTVPAFAAVRQAFAFAGVAQSGQIPYTLRGKLASGLTGTTRFVDQGTLSLPALGMALP
ncbi:LEA type 2 family protein [Paraburkholderia sp. BCC1884]|uniref:LEA type 2 family protein n=1 Tax=Paraburkholderia sp. BCC1884 TaxID=2562668 RepID=UPI0021B29970|nr:LEA type 2 family protein [Paraburkholderia sp. BCC1884]